VFKEEYNGAFVTIMADTTEALCCIRMVYLV
jgi:hypothetical protein